MRAFLNGRIDLTQAESIAELVSAQSITASQVALAGLQGLCHLAKRDDKSEGHPLGNAIEPHAQGGREDKGRSGDGCHDARSLTFLCARDRG